MQVFISYSRRDAGFVRGLADDLTARGIDIWLDTEDLATADDDRWRRSIVQGIRGSSVLVVVLSPDSVASEQVERELTIAAETKRRIIPIVQRPCELPDGFQFELAGIQRIDFSELPRDVALDHLVRRIGVTEAAPADPEPDPPLPPPDPSAAPQAAAAMVGATSVPPPSPMTETVSEPATARPEQREAPVISSPPAGPSRPRWRLVAAVLGAGAAVALVIVLVMTLGGGSDGGVGGDDRLVATTAGDTVASIATQGGNDASSADSVQTSAELEGSPPAETGESQAQPDEVDASTRAQTLVKELQEAFNSRDWDTVRRITGQPTTDEAFIGTYGTADAPKVEQAGSVVLRDQRVDASTLLLQGALVSLDYRPDGQPTTTVICVDWLVNPDEGTAPRGETAGTERQHLDEWLDPDQFESTARQYCG